MRAKTVGYFIAALSPFWLLALLAIQGRYFVSPYEEHEYGQEATDKILAYGMVLRYTKLHELKLENLDQESLDSVANRWMKHYREDILSSIAPIHPDDDGTTGFRGEIESSRRQILIALNRDLNKKLESQDFEGAATRLDQIAVISNVAKFNSTFSTFFSSSAQMHTIDVFESIKSRISNDTRNLVYQSIIEIETKPDLIRHTADRMAVISSRRVTEDSVKLPARAEMTYILNEQKRGYEMSPIADTQGILLAESFRVAYQQEIQLEKRLNSYRVTALKTN